MTDRPEAELVVCALLERCPDGKPNFDDDEKALCAGCHRVIVFRPYSKPVKVKMCVECARRFMISQGLKPTFMMDPDVVKDLRFLWSKPKGVH